MNSFFIDSKHNTVIFLSYSLNDLNISLNCFATFIGGNFMYSKETYKEKQKQTRKEIEKN